MALRVQNLGAPDLVGAFDTKLNFAPSILARPLTHPEACDYLCLSRSSLQGAINRRDIKPVKLGGRTLFRRVDLDALIEWSSSPEPMASAAMRYGKPIEG